MALAACAGGEDSVVAGRRPSHPGPSQPVSGTGAAGGAGGAGGAGSASGPPVVSGGPPVVSSGPLSPGPSRDVTAPNLVRPDPSLINLRPLRWSKATVTGGGRTVLVDFVLGAAPCGQLGRVDVGSRPDAVTVTLLIGDRPDYDCSGPRPLIAMLARTTVTLDAPVGARPVRDGAA